MGQLLDNAEIIRDETTPGANTAQRVGGWMVEAAEAIEAQPLVYVADISYDQITQEFNVIEKTNSANLNITFVIEAVGYWAGYISEGPEQNRVSVYASLKASPSNQGLVFGNYLTNVINLFCYDVIAQEQVDFGSAVQLKIEVYP